MQQRELGYLEGQCKKRILHDSQLDNMGLKVSAEAPRFTFDSGCESYNFFGSLFWPPKPCFGGRFASFSSLRSQAAVEKLKERRQELDQEMAAGMHSPRLLGFEGLDWQLTLARVRWRWVKQLYAQKT